MTPMKNSRTLSLLILVLMVAVSSHASACAACWGDTSGSKSTHAAAVGIGAMVVIIFAMLGTIAACGWRLAWRAKHPLPDYSELLNESGPSSSPDSKP